jgi:hypothetical protein
MLLLKCKIQNLSMAKEPMSTAIPNHKVTLRKTVPQTSPLPPVLSHTLLTHQVLNPSLPQRLLKMPFLTSAHVICAL